MSYPKCLVAWKVLNLVEEGFIPVGHTHDDIDQAFSETSERLRRNNALSFQDLQIQLRNSYNSETEVTDINSFANWPGIWETERC